MEIIDVECEKAKGRVASSGPSEAFDSGFQRPFVCSAAAVSKFFLPFYTFKNVHILYVHARNLE